MTRPFRKKLTLKQAAEFLGFDPTPANKRKVHDLVRKHGLQTVRLGETANASVYVFAGEIEQLGQRLGL